MSFLDEIYNKFEVVKSYSLAEIKQNKYGMIPNNKGVYVVFAPKSVSVEILDTIATRDSYTKNGKTRSMIQNKEELIEKFKKGDQGIIYIGQSTNLNKRVKEYIDQGFGASLKHRGGITMFQIKDWISLELIFIEEEDSVRLENELLTEYYAKYNTLPMANKNKGINQ